MMDKEQLMDYERIGTADYIEWEKLKDQNIYITGATGLIGSTLVKSILFISEKKNLNIKIIVLVRNLDRAKALLGCKKIKFYQGDLQQVPFCNERVDYIIHCANPTSSNFFVTKPVETIKTAVLGTLNLLELAKEKKVKSFIFLSTMEVFGTPQKGHKVLTNEAGIFDSAVVRNSYPLSKQVCENLCVSYSKEYNVSSMVIRLTQTFGPGVDYNDGRVFCEFARCAIENKNIVLKTKGETERSYLYTADAVTAILTVMLHGESGEIYVAANEDTYCSIYEMAQLVADMYGINVVIEEQDITRFGYANTLYMDLDTSKLQNLGWRPEVALKEAYHKLIDSMRVYGIKNVSDE